MKVEENKECYIDDTKKVRPCRQNARWKNAKTSNANFIIEIRKKERPRKRWVQEVEQKEEMG